MTARQRRSCNSGCAPETVFSVAESMPGPRPHSTRGACAPCPFTSRRERSSQRSVRGLSRRSRLAEHRLRGRPAAHILVELLLVDRAGREERLRALDVLPGQDQLALALHDGGVGTAHIALALGDGRGRPLDLALALGMAASARRRSLSR